MLRNAQKIAEIPIALLAGGLATRLRPVTEQIPKAMIDINGRPFIDYQMALYRRHGVRRVVLCLGHLGQQVEGHLGDGEALGLQLQYSYDGARLLGTGGALRRALHLLGDVFWVCYGDSYTEVDYRAILDFFQSRNFLGLMTVIKNADHWDRSNAIFAEGQLIRYSKRVKDPSMKYIDFGVALLRREAIERIPLDCPYDLAQLYEELVDEKSMVGYEVHQRFYEIGTPSSLEETRTYLNEIKI